MAIRVDVRQCGAQVGGSSAATEQRQRGAARRHACGTGEESSQRRGGCRDGPSPRRHFSQAAGKQAHCTPTQTCCRSHQGPFPPSMQHAGAPPAPAAASAPSSSSATPGTAWLQKLMRSYWSWNTQCHLQVGTGAAKHAGRSRNRQTLPHAGPAAVLRLLPVGRCSTTCSASSAAQLCSATWGAQLASSLTKACAGTLPRGRLQACRRQRAERGWSHLAAHSTSSRAAS